MQNWRERERKKNLFGGLNGMPSIFYECFCFFVCVFVFMCVCVCVYIRVLAC